MKAKIICILIMTLLIATAVSVTGIIKNYSKSVIIQPPEEWSRTYGGTSYDYGNSVQLTADNGYIITGITESYGAGGTDIWLIKTDSNGTEEWSKTFGGLYNDEAYYVLQTSDEGYIITGFTESYGAGGKDIWLIKTDSNGNEDWNKTFGGDGDDSGESIIKTTNGDYIIIGRTESYGAGDYDAWLIKTDSNGEEQWNKTYGGSNYDSSRSGEQIPDEGYIITGNTWSYGEGERDAWLIKTDSNGEEQWNKTYGGYASDAGNSIELSSDGGYFIAGTTKSFGAGNWDYYLIKTDEDGNEVWSKTYGGGAGDASRYCIVTSDDKYIITGWTCSFGAGSYDIWLIKTDSDGDLIWSETYGGWNADSSMCVRQTNDEGYIISGGTETYGAGNYDVWLVKVKGESDPPSEPTIDGPNSGELGIEYEYTFNSTDPNDLSVYYMINWGDGYITNWLGPFSSGVSVVKSHEWSEPGTFFIKAQAKNINGSHSNWSDPFEMVIENDPPNSPSINGPTSGKKGTAYPYTFISTDPNGEYVSYYLRWGDGTITSWTDFQGSGPPGYVESHSWDTQGTYIIQAKAKDIWGAESEWAEFTVTIPRDKAINRPILNWLQSHPFLFPLLQKLIQQQGFGN